ncbi:hypothetical protein, partial [Prochlorothrix hollandica]|uniref:hypothetical protein n=1 Tax=Prochlorothrix hollandica TaxID=1223 RepID=UPI00334179CD
MNTSDAPSGNHLLLPRLKDKSDIKAGNPGQWEIRNRTAFEGVAKSLDYEAPGLTRGISSVPTLWARPLLVEMTLHDESNPLHQDMVGQWRGMLAAIALAHLRNFPLKIRLLELIKLQGQQEFGEALLDLIPPARRNNLYELPEDRTVSGNPNLSRNPWQDLYLLFWNDRPVGTTSPSTFVVPSEEADWSGLPWWIFDNNRSRLQSPERFLNDDEKQLLWLWLDQLGENLPGVQPFATPASRLHTLIANFQAVLKEPDSSSDINTYLQRDDYFGLRLNRGCLGLLGRPLKGNESRESSLQLQGIQGGDDVPLVILDNQISDQWGVPTQSLYVFQGETLAYFLNPDGTINGDRLKTKQQEWGQQVRCVTLADLFSPRLTFLDGAPAELLPNALFPPGMRLLWEGSEFTPLIPLNSLLLDYLSPQTLSQALRFDTLNTGQGPALKVSVTLQLTGLDGQGQACTLSQVYRLDSGNRLPDVPVLDIWPNFRAHQPTPDGGFKTWQHYYAFYCDSRYGDRTFKVTVPNLSREADATHCYMDAGQQFQISRLTDFPPYIQCQNNSTGEDIGLILLTVPEVMTLTKSWDVGVDFGTSFTNIYVNPEGNALPSQLSLESVNYKVTKSLELDRKLALVEYFMDDTFAPEDLSPLPLSSVVTSRKSRTGVDRDLHQSVIDGRIYIPDNRTFDPRLDYIKTGLKLNSRDDENDRRLFLEHLALHITAMAAKAGVRSITWHASYPSAFSRNERRSYEDRWRTLPETLTTTGLDHQFRGLKTEALAVGQYFQDFEGTAYDLLRTTCLDMGGGTSDISIWNDRTLVHQCSVQLAGRDLFTEVLKVKPGFVVNRIIKSLDKGQNKATDLAEWDNLSQVAFNAKL